MLLGRGSAWRPSRPPRPGSCGDGALEQEDVGLLAGLEDAELGVDGGLGGARPSRGAARGRGTAARRSARWTSAGGRRRARRSVEVEDEARVDALEGAGQSAARGCGKDNGAPGERRGAVCGQADDSRGHVTSPLGPGHGGGRRAAPHGDGGAARRQPDFRPRFRRAPLRGRWHRRAVDPAVCPPPSPRAEPWMSHRRHVGRSVAVAPASAGHERCVSHRWPLGPPARPVRGRATCRPSRSAWGWSARRAVAAPDPRGAGDGHHAPQPAVQEPSVPGRGGAGTNVPSFVPTRTVFPRCSCSPVPGGIRPGPGGEPGRAGAPSPSRRTRSRFIRWTIGTGGSSAVAGSGGDRAAERQLQLGHPDEVVVDVHDGVARALQDAGGDAGPEAGAAVDPDLAARAARRAAPPARGAARGGHP